MAAVGIHARLRRWSNCASSDQSPGPMSVSRHCTRQPSPHPRHPGFGTDDEHRRHGRQLLAQPDAVGLGAQHPLVLVGSAQPAGPSAGGDHQPVVGHGPGGGVHGPRVGVECRRRRLQTEVDLGGQGREDDVVDRPGAGEHPLRQGHAGVRRHVLVGEHGDPAVELLHAQHLHRGQRRDRTAGDDDLARHGATLSAATGTRAPRSRPCAPAPEARSRAGGPRRRRRRGRRRPAPCRRRARGPRTAPGRR